MAGRPKARALPATVMVTRLPTKRRASAWGEPDSLCFICLALHGCMYDRCPMDAAQAPWEGAPAQASTGNQVAGERGIP
jgi:hypothetical protein